MRSEAKLLGTFCLPSAFRRCCGILCPGVAGSHWGKGIRLSFPTSTRCRPSRSVESLYLHSAAVHVVSVCVSVTVSLLSSHPPLPGLVAKMYPHSVHWASPDCRRSLFLQVNK